MRTRWRIGTAALILLVGFFLYAIYTPTVRQPEGVQFTVTQGTSRSAFINELHQQGIIHHPLLFSLYTQPQMHKQIKAGEYLFPRGATPAAIWYQVTHGLGWVYYSMTIVPGWTFNKILTVMQQAPALSHTLAGIDGNQIMQRLGETYYSPEGMFFPETYYYTRGTPDIVILKKAYQLMQKKIALEWQNRRADLPYQSPYEALIAASLIEKEAYRKEERPVIAGVLVNRLRKGMLLQFDPTVIYGLGARYEGKIYKSDLVEDTPYNTYRHKGLPPTPIAMPSLASIQAALHPTQHDYFYFVAVGNGSHHFSQNLVEHHSMVSTLIKQSNVFFNESIVQRYVTEVLPKLSLNKVAS